MIKEPVAIPAVLNPCPCCGALVDIVKRKNEVMMICSQYGCREVKARTYADAAKLWNAPRFSEGPA